MSDKNMQLPQVASYLLLACLVFSFVLAYMLPQRMAWENGLLENMQTLVLLLGFFTALIAAWQQATGNRQQATGNRQQATGNRQQATGNRQQATGNRQQAAAPLYWIAAVFWLVLAGRELAWGAAFLPPIGFSEDGGPVVSSRMLWYKPAVPYIVAVLFLVCIYWAFRYKIFSHGILRIYKEKAFPWFDLMVFILAMIVSSDAEGHGFISLHELYRSKAMVLEELAELIGYLALLNVQWRFMRQTGRWQLQPEPAVYSEET